MTRPEDDPGVRALREQISDNDRAIVEAVNRRLELVARLKQLKEARGMAFHDPDREAWMEQYLLRGNRGPLSREGLRAFYAGLLDLTKREVKREES